MELQNEVKIRQWIIFTELGRDAIPYRIKSTNLDVNEDELALCIEAQLFPEDVEVVKGSMTDDL
jgi:hypothetical protein